MADVDTPTTTAAEAPPEAGNGRHAQPVGPPDVWQLSKNGREYTSRPDKRGVIYRQDGETIAEALDRDRQLESMKKPQRGKAKRPPMPEAPRQLDLKELEATLAEALKAPAVMCASFGDEWAADHFTMTGPYLARNLILASDHNPWLRRKLEEAASGEDAMMKVVSLVGVGGALFMYVVPPAIYWFNLPVPTSARRRFGIPDGRHGARAPDYAATGQDAGIPPTPPPAEPPAEPEPVTEPFAPAFTAAPPPDFMPAAFDDAGTPIP
jgi:hypothetical protein